MDFNDVAMFVQVVRAGSFVEAARRMGLPANTLSRHISKLEARLGTRLLQRSTRKLSLTVSGQKFYERCDLSIAGLDQAVAELRATGESPRGRIRVAAPADFLDLFHMEKIVEFLAQYPEVRLDFELDDAPVDLIAEGIDVALRGGDLTDSTLVARKLGDVYGMLVASPGYLAAHGTPESLRALGTHHCVTASGRAERTRWKLHGPEGIDEVEVSGRFRASTALARVDGALAGLGIALLSEPRIAAYVKCGELVRVLPQYRRELGGFYAVFASRQQLPLAVSAFVEFVAEAFAAE